MAYKVLVLIATFLLVLITFTLFFEFLGFWDASLKEEWGNCVKEVNMSCEFWNSSKPPISNTIIKENKLNISVNISNGT